MTEPRAGRPRHAFTDFDDWLTGKSGWPCPAGYPAPSRPDTATATSTGRCHAHGLALGWNIWPHWRPTHEGRPMNDVSLVFVGIALVLLVAVVILVLASRNSDDD